MVSRLVVSQVSVSGLAPVRPARSARTLWAAAMPSADRSTLTWAVIASWSGRRTSPGTRPGVRMSVPGSRQGRSSPGSTVAMRRENTSPSSSELEASRLAPCTPEQATSPVA